MSSALTWTKLNASELIDALDEDRLSDIIPRSAGIYLWRRSFVPPSHCKQSAEAFREWISNIAKQPAAKVTRRALTHCVWSDGIQVGGGGLTEEKLQTLKAISSQRNVRQLVLSFAESLSDFAPIIYVGETNDLRSRVKQHLRGETELLPYLRDVLGFQWEDIEFRLFVTSKAQEVSEKAKAVQTLLEMLAQRALAPFGTTRPG